MPLGITETTKISKAFPCEYQKMMTQSPLLEAQYTSNHPIPDSQQARDQWLLKMCH